MDEWKDDIEKYLAGQLSPTDRHALEKKALNDPFLADALEGAESIPANQFSSDLNELNQKINQSGKNRWLWPLRIAASMVGFALISAAIFLSVQDDSNNHLASNKKNSEATPPSPKKDSVGQVESQSESEEKKSSARAEENDEEKRFIAEHKKEKEKKPESNQPKGKDNDKQLAGGSGLAAAQLNGKKENAGPTIIATDSISPSGQAFSPTESKSAEFADVAEIDLADDALATIPIQQPIAKQADTAFSLAKRSKAINLLVTGEVRDQQGQPLPGVNVTAKGSIHGTTTNAEGKYAITLGDQNQTLVYSFIGFVAQEQPVDKKKPTQLDVQLQEDATQLSEVVVTGYGTQKNDAEPVVRLAEPDGGRKAYDQYLEDKKIYPQQALINKIEGKVIIEFTVTTSGVLTDFNVIRKLGYGCEDEVIRLVKEGPKWKPTYIDNEAVESLVRIKTKFDLPGRK